MFEKVENNRLRSELDEGICDIMIKKNQRFIKMMLVGVVLATLTLPSCARGSVDASSAEQLSRELQNCDTPVSVDPTPERVVTIKSTPLELLLALGLEDRVVGSAFLDGPVPEELAPAGWEVEEISDQVPGRELLLSMQPDFVFAGWASNLTADGPGTRDELLKLGIRSYVSPAACDFGEAAGEPMDFNDVFTMFDEVGQIFDVRERSDELITGQRDRLDAVTLPSRSPTAIWYSSGEDTPFVGGGTGVPNMIMEAAGIENVVADQPESWLSLSWEAFVASDPEIIVLVDSPWNSAEAKRDRIEAHPAAQQMRAVRAGDFVTVDFAMTEAGVRNVDAVKTIAEQAAEIVNRNP